jgi:tetratricopeptide (TPR) repeat protein
MRFLLLPLFALAVLAQSPVQTATADQRIATFEKALKASPNDAKAQAGLAAAFIQKLRETTDFAFLNRASGLVDKMLAANPKNYDALRLKAEIETHRHNFPLAAKLSQELLERNPSDAGAYGMLGDSLMELGKYDEAGQAYQQMLSLGANLSSYNRVAYHRFVTGKTNDALSWMMTAVRAGSNTPENLAWCLVEFGDMLAKTGHVEDARAAYQQALDILPGYHRALAAQGRQLAAAGEFEPAVANFKKAQAVIPLPEYGAALEALYAKTGNAAEAAKQRALLDAIDKLGQANGEKGNRALAAAYADENRNAQRAVELASAEMETRKDVYAYDALSWALLRAGRQKDAAEASAHALAQRTPEPMFLYHAGVIALEGGDRARGEELLRAALDLNPAFAFPQADDARKRLAQVKTVAERATNSKFVIH